jgi:hypothetical protein
VQLVVGNYTHAQNEAVVSISREIVRSPRNIGLRWRETWNISGRLQATVGVTDGAAQTWLTGQIIGMQESYVDGVNAVLYDNAGGMTAHALISGDSFDGVRVTQAPSFPDGDGAEYSRWRSYTAQLQAEFPLAGVNPTLLEFRETLTFNGGGFPIKRAVTPPAGEVIIVTVSERSPYFATQSGRLLATIQDHPVPQPIWPDQMTGEGGTTKASPEVSGVRAVSFERTWSYEFVSDKPLTGIPNDPR